jgi:hypothetical protein
VAGDVDFGEAERLLREAEFLDCRPLWYSSNYVYLAQLCADGEQFAAVYKPRKGESPLWDFPEGTLCQREVAAYALSRLLDWPIVPPTVLRDGPQGIGSVQVYIAHDPEQHFFVQREDESLLGQLQRMCVFDAVANNADRKGGHCLLDSEGRIWGIDQGLCFHTQYKLRSVIWDWAGEPIDEPLLEDVERAALEIAAETDAAAPLLSLLDDLEARALLSRMEKLLRDRKFPLPGANRHYPWPLV